MRLNRGIIILVCLCLGVVGVPWSLSSTAPSPARYASAFDLMPEGTRRDTLEWTQEYIEKIIPLDIWEAQDSREAFQLVQRGDFVRWLVRARNLTLVESDHVFEDVDSSNPNHAYIMTALEAGIIEKTATFHPHEPVLRADAGIWLVNAHGALARKRAEGYAEPLIPAQDGYDGIPARAVGALSVCYAPEYQLMEYRHKALDPYRYVQAQAPLLRGEAAFSLYQLVYPPRRGGELNVMISQSPLTLFLGLDAMTSMRQITSAVYENCTRGSDPSWASFPSLIKRIPTFENGLWVVHHDENGDFSSMELTFELRKGLKWSDGRPLTADDFVFGHYLYQHPSFPTLHSEVVFWIDQVEAIDEYTIKSTWNTPYRFANSISPMPRHYFEEKFDYHLEPYSLNDPDYFMPPSSDNPEGYKSERFYQDETFIRKCANDELYNTQPLHAGPYRVKEWNESQNYIILEPNEHYFLGAPLLNEITFRVIESMDFGVRSILEGNIDLCLTLLTPDNAAIIDERSKNVSSHAISSLIWEHLDLNVDDEVFSDIRVRHALIHGINREKITQELFQGKIDIAHSWFPPQHPAYDDEQITKYAYDKEKAKSLLDEAGWKLNPDTGIREKDGKPLEITFITTAGNRQREEAQAIIASDWKAIGVQVNIRNESPTSFFVGTLRERRFDGPTITMYAWIMGLHSNLYSLLHSNLIPTRENHFSGQNYTGFQHEEVDKILDQIRKELSSQTIYTLLKTVQTIITHELPSIPLFFRPDTTAVHRDLAMYRPSGTLSPHTWNIAYWYWKYKGAQPREPQISVKPSSLSFFDVAQGFKSSQKITITNEGTNLLEGSLFTDSPCLALEMEAFSLKPFQSQEIQVTLDPSLIEEAGPWEAEIQIHSNDPEHASIILPVQANLPPPRIEQPLYKIDFGRLSRREPGQVSLNITNAGGKTLSIKVSSPYPALTISEAELDIPPRGSKSILLSLNLDLIETYGDFESTLHIESNDPYQPNISLPFKGSYGVVIQLQIGNPVSMINGEPQPPFEAPPFIHQGRTMLPLRFIAEAFGADLQYIPVPREIQITMDLMRIRLWIDNPKAIIEPLPPSEEPIKEIMLDAPPIIRYARSFVPIRFIAETFGATVEWEASTQMITIYYKG